MYAVALAFAGMERRWLSEDLAWKFGTENAKLFETMGGALQWVYARGYHDSSAGHREANGPGTLEIVRMATRPVMKEVVA